MNIYFEGPKYQRSTFECASKFVAVLLVKKILLAEVGKQTFFKSPDHGWGGEGQPALIKKKRKVSSYIRKFRVEQLQR
jgi:hypothetical protein